MPAPTAPHAASQRRGLLRRAVALLTACVVAGAAPADEAPSLRLPPVAAVDGVDAADAAAYQALVGRVVAIVRSNPALARPAAGYCLELVAEPPRRAGPALVTRLRLQGVKRDAGGACQGPVQPGIEITLDDPAAFYPADGMPGLEGRPLGTEHERYYLTPLPERRAPTPRFPSYRGAVFIAAAEPQPFVVVSKSEHLAALDRLWQHGIAEARRQGRETVYDTTRYPFLPPLPGRILERVRNELAALPEAARMLPACWLNTGEVKPWLLTSGGTQGCGIERQLVRVNPALWPQGERIGSRFGAIVVSGEPGQKIGFDRGWAEWTRLAMKSFDYDALGELVERRRSPRTTVVAQGDKASAPTMAKAAEVAARP